MVYLSEPSCEDCHASRKDAGAEQAAGAPLILASLCAKKLQYGYTFGVQELVVHFQELHVETAATSIPALQRSRDTVLLNQGLICNFAEE